MQERRALVIFARAPELGRVKTRLAVDIGEAAALAVYRALVDYVIAAVAPVPRCRTVLAFTPAESAAKVRAWLGESIPLEAQGSGDLGSRMIAAVRARHAEGARRIVVIGTDCPAVDAARVSAAFDVLDDADVVLGPAADGGYYLIGMRDPHAQLFDRIPWSTPRTLAETMTRAREAGLSVGLLREEHDIDTATDLERWAAAMRTAAQSASDARCP